MGDLFEIQNTPSFNSDKLASGTEYDYVTRTSINQGVLQQTGFINYENINEAGCWSLGLLQMDFFYRRKPWYAGQFIRKITPKFEVKVNIDVFFTTLLNQQKKKLLSVLVRNVDQTFLESNIQLPTKNGEIDFDFMESFIAELEAERIAELEAYLTATGLKDYMLTEKEQIALDDYKTGKIAINKFNVVDIFDVKNTQNILSRDVVECSGGVPYLCASTENNAVSSYIKYDKKYLEKGNCVFIGGKTFVVTYQEKNFYSNDSHNLALYLKDKQNKLVQLYLVTCVQKGLGYKYSWGDSISNKKIQADKVFLPTKNDQPDFDFMEMFIKVIQKLVIKDVVLYADGKINATKQVADSN